MQGAWKVGLLVLVFVALLIAAYAMLGRSMFANKTNEYYAEFSDAGGVTPGTRVLMAGVRIGEVTEVRLVNPNLARLVLHIETEYKIPAGSTAVLPSSLIGIGDNPIQISPPAQIAGYLPPKTVIPGRRGSAVESLLPEASKTLEELNKTIAATRKIIEEQGLTKRVEEVLSTGEETVKKFGEIATRMDSLIASNQATINATVTSASRAMADIQESTALVKELLADDRWRDKALQMLDSLNATATRAQELVASIQSFVDDPELRASLKETLANTQKLSETSNRIAENAERISLNAEEISKNGITISEEVVTLSKKANEIADEAKTLLEKLQGFFGKSPSAGSLSNIGAELSVIRESDPSFYRTDIEFDLPILNYSLHFGLFDAFESNKVNLQLGRPFGADGRLRYGIYASKPGIGVDYQLAPRLFARGDLFDINNPRADIRLRYEFGNGFFGWLGVNKVFDRNAPLIGIGFRK